jgi:sugar phosphate isomerase/epimerase
MRCSSTHNGEASFTPEGLKKAVEFNQILGSKYVVMAGSSPIANLAGWKALSERITRIMATLTPLGMASGFHNHEEEWALVEGKRPMDVLAANTPKEFMFQLDVGTCIAAKADPVAWIKANPGRTKSIHCKDWAHWPWGGYRVLLGAGGAPWAQIIEAAETVGGVECYLIEQEGSHYPPLDTARRCLETWKHMRA